VKAALSIPSVVHRIAITGWAWGLSGFEASTLKSEDEKEIDWQEREKASCL